MTNSITFRGPRNGFPGPIMEGAVAWDGATLAHHPKIRVFPGDPILVPSGSATEFIPVHGSMAREIDGNIYTIERPVGISRTRLAHWLYRVRQFRLELSAGDLTDILLTVDGIRSEDPDADDDDSERRRVLDVRRYYGYHDGPTGPDPEVSSIHYASLLHYPYPDHMPWQFPYERIVRGTDGLYYPNLYIYGSRITSEDVEGGDPIINATFYSTIDGEPPPDITLSPTTIGFDGLSLTLYIGHSELPTLSVGDVVADEYLPWSKPDGSPLYDAVSGIPI